MEFANRWYWQSFVGSQLHNDYPQNASAGHDAYENADFCVERVRINGFGGFCFSYFDCYLDVAVSRQGDGNALFYHNGGRQSDDVRQSHLGVGTSGSLHFDFTGIRSVFRNCTDVFG